MRTGQTPPCHKNRGLPSKRVTSKVVGYATQTKGKMETSRKRTMVCVGPDADDTQYHGLALDKNTGEIIIALEADIRTPASI